jgi:hypothetical protein
MIAKKPAPGPRSGGGYGLFEEIMVKKTGQSEMPIQLKIILVYRSEIC